MAKHTESRKLPNGTQIIVNGGSNISRECVKNTADFAANVADSLDIKPGTLVVVEAGTRASRCGERRNGVHYQYSDRHVLGIHGRLFNQFYPTYQGRSTIAHEMIHAAQFSSGRCESKYNYQTGRWYYTFSGEWTGNQGHRKYVEQIFHRVKKPSYSTYRNFAWEQEAFECQEQVSNAAWEKTQNGEKPVAPVKIISDKPFCCPHCGKGYASRQGRYNHIRKNACGQVPQE